MTSHARAGRGPASGGGRLVQRKAPVAPRMDHHERQADQRARDFLAGRVHLSHGLTPAPAAGFVLADSVGERLPPSLRASLEQAFDARLDAVRIHRDAAAGAAADRLHARAFASGPRIYFSPSAWQPASADGRELIAHELTHVLQQAGRVTGGNVLEVRPVAADGAVQCAPRQPPSASLGFQYQAFDDMVAIHRGNAPHSDDKDLEGAIEALRSALGGRLVADYSKPAFSATFNAQALTTKYRAFKSAPARSFLFDCLKVLGHFPAAGAMLADDRGFKLRTLYRSPELMKFLHEDPAFGRKWLGQFLDVAPFKTWWPASIARGWRAFYLRPTLVPPPDARLSAAAMASHGDEGTKQGAIPPALHTEAHWLAWELLGELEFERRQEQTRLQAQLVALSGRRPIFETLHEHLKGWRTREAAVAADNDRAPWEMTLAAARIPLLDEAITYWDDAFADFGRWEARLGTLAHEALAAKQALDLPDGSLVAAAASALKAPFLKAVGEVFKLRETASEQALPEADEYAQQLKALARSLTETAFATTRKGTPATWWVHTQDLAFDEATRTKPDRQRLAQFAIFPLITSRLLGLISAYDAAADQKASHFDDARRSHRLMLARLCNALGRWLGWTEIIDATQAVLRGTETAELGKKAQLLLVDDWQVDEGVPIAGMLADFPGNVDKPILRDAPFTVMQLVEWFRFDYHHRMRETLEQLLRAEDWLSKDTVLDFTVLDHVKQTRKDVQASMGATAEAEYAIDTPAKLAIKSPQRFSVNRFDLIVPPGVTLEWEHLLATHEKTFQQLGRRAGGLIFPTQPKQGVFAWALPPLDGLIAALRALPGVADIVARKSGESDADWLQRLRPVQPGPDGKVADADLRKVHLGEADWKRLNSVLMRWIQLRAQRDEAVLPDLWRRLVVMRRRWLAMTLLPRIRHFAANPYVSHGPAGESRNETLARLDTPELVVKVLREFEGSARPARELPAGAGAQAVEAERRRAQQAVDAQLVLLTLTLAPALLDIDRAQMGPYLRSHLYEYFQLAIDNVEDAKGMAALRAGLGIHDEAAVELLSPDRLAHTIAGMKAFIAAVEEDLRETQGRHGFASEDGNAIKPNLDRGGYAIKPNPRNDAHEEAAREWHIHMSLDKDGEMDPSTGDTYRLVKVFHKFDFHPQVGAEPNRRLRKGAGGAFSAAWIEIEENGKTTRYTAPDLPDIDLFKINIKRGGKDATDTIVNARDIELLTELDDIFFWRSYVIGINELGSAIKTIGDWILTVGSVFFPEIAMGEFIFNIARMLKDHEIQDLIEQLKDDPVAFAEHMLSKLAQLFDPDKIWEYVLLGGGADSPLAALEDFFSSRKHKVNADREGGTSKFARVVHALRSLGERFARGLHVVHEYTQPPLRRVQGEVAMRPTLAWVLRRSVHLVEAAMDVIPALELEGKGGKLTALLGTLLGGNGENLQQDLSDRVVNLLEGVRQIELPGELVDLGAATELIIGFILDRFGKRGKLLRMALSTMPVPDSWDSDGNVKYTNALSFLSKKIADTWWKGSQLDPNKYWAEKLLPKVGEEFDSLKTSLVDGLYALVNKALDAIGLDEVHPPVGDAIKKTEVHAEPLMESEASAPAGARAAGQPRLDVGGGMPLAAGARAGYERHLGADLSHVRLHTDAGAATGPVGADALTSGSHVFLRPGVAPASREGQRLLAHELTHVVQQTGAAAGAPGARAPTLGRPGIGLHVDPAREGAADAVASRLGSGQPVSPSLRAQIGHAQGVQPSLATRVASSVIDTLSTANHKEDFTHRLEGGQDPEGFATAQQLANQVFAAVKSGTGIEFAEFLRGKYKDRTVASLVLAYLSEATAKFPEIELKRIAQLGQKPHARQKPDDPETVFNPPSFLQLLANYLFAERHVALEITLSKTSVKVGTIKVLNLNMGEINGNTTLWEAVMANTFGHVGAVKDLAKAQREMRERLRDEGPLPLMWHRTEFRFSDSVVASYLDLLKAREAGKVDDVPPLAQYLDTKSSSGHGLAVSTHGSLTNGSRSIGTFDRESHHTTQYLLAEFFGNAEEASHKAFPGDPDDFNGAGINFSTNGKKEVDNIAGSSGKALKLRELDPDSGRGNGMPAILLAARTHQRGELHVLRETRWDDASGTNERKGTSTQGLAIQNQFHNAIANEKLRPRDTSPSHREELRKEIGKNRVAAQNDYYNAALKTYHWMSDRMIRALLEGMKREELAYYRGIAARNHADANGKLPAAYDMQESDLVKVHGVAEDNNTAVMGRNNWK